jgi:hypothetical protein
VLALVLVLVERSPSYRKNMFFPRQSDALYGLSILSTAGRKSVDGLQVANRLEGLNGLSRRAFFNRRVV